MNLIAKFFSKISLVTKRIFFVAHGSEINIKFLLSMKNLQDMNFVY